MKKVIHQTQEHREETSIQNSEVFVTPFGEFLLDRFPIDPTKTLRAWDAADEYLLQQTDSWLTERKQDSETAQKKPKILIIHDLFAVLSTVLHAYQPHCWSDSVTSKIAIQHQALRNKIKTTATFTAATDTPRFEADLVLIKLPKNLHYLHDVLLRLRSMLTPTSTIIAAGMVKHWSPSIQSLFEKTIGPSHTSRAVKKARCLFAEAHFDQNNAALRKTTLKDQVLDLVLTHESNVYGQDHLDLGARLMIDAMPALPALTTDAHVADLGCGNGVLAILCLREYLSREIRLEIDLIDDSFMAIASAQENLAQNLTGEIQANYYVSNGFDQIESHAAYELILCNPPFHQEHTVTDLLAKMLFDQCRERLAPSGELWVVGNRHLPYFQELKKRFRSVKTIKSNPKFLVLRARH